MGPKKRHRGSHSKQSNVKSTDHTKGDTEKPMEKKSNQTESVNDIKRVPDPYNEWYNSLDQQLDVLCQFGGIPKSSHQRVHRYWDSLSIDSKKEFLKIKVTDLKNYFNNPELYLDNYIDEVVKSAKIWESWIAWVCFDCRAWHKDPDSCAQHIWAKLSGTLPSEMYTLFPQTVNKDWFEDLNEPCWEPLDAFAAIQMLENKAKSEENSSTKACYWQQLNDSERAKYLKNIQRELNLLLRHKCLADSYFTHVIKSAKDEISELHEGSQILNDALDQSPHCICFLGVPKLKMIYGFLLKLVNACGLVIRVDKVTDPPDDLQNCNEIPEIKGEIHVIEDGSCLLLDESLLHDPDTIESATGDDVIYTDPFLSWLFSDSCFEQWDIWDGIKAEKIIQQENLVKTMQKEIEELLEHCKKKCYLREYDLALKVVEVLCLEEDENRDNIPEYVQRRYESVLRMRKEELNNSEERVSNTSELNAITNVLEEAQIIKANQSGSEENPTGAYDLESQMDIYIRTAIEQLKGTQFEQLCMIDGKILRDIANTDQLKAKFGRASAFDFRGQFLPLLKTCLKRRLDDLAAKYASDLLLAEVAAESEKSVKGRSDKAKHKERTKSNNRTEENRKTNTSDLEATHGYEQDVIDTNITGNSPAVPDKKKRLEERLIEIQAEKKSIAEQKKELEKEREQFNIEMGKKEDHLAHQRKEREDEEENIRIELEKLDDEA